MSAFACVCFCHRGQKINGKVINCTICGVKDGRHCKPTKETWEGELSSMIYAYNGGKDGGVNEGLEKPLFMIDTKFTDKLKDFIRKEIEQAKKEERERVLSDVVRRIEYKDPEKTIDELVLEMLREESNQRG